MPRPAPRQSHNIDVPTGLANGTCATLEQIITHPNEQPIVIELNSGVKVKAFYASQVHCLVLRHQNAQFKNALFDIRLEEAHSVIATIDVMGAQYSNLSEKKAAEEKIRMKFNQFSVVRNTATTGHKLQGKSVDNIFVFSQPQRKQTQTEKGFVVSRIWRCVVLSRVREFKGLYLKNPTAVADSL